MARVLIVEDNAETQLLLQHLLSANYQVDVAADLATARERIARQLDTWDVIILDRSLPDGDGVRLCAELQKYRNTHNFSILMLTAHGSSSERIEGLNVGADDYLVKPFIGGELIARVEALVRRKRLQGSFSATLTIANLIINFETHTAYIQREHEERLALDLTPIEFKILSTLAKNFGKEMDRAQLARAVWENTNLSARNIDTHVCHIRKKIADSAVVIKNRRGLGYYMEEKPVTTAPLHGIPAYHMPLPESETEHALHRSPN